MPVLLTRVKKLLNSGHHHSAWSLLNPIKMAFSARMIDKITGSIEESILLVLQQYRLGLQEITHLKIPALDDLVTVLEVLFMTHKSNKMKVELVNFKDEIIKTLMHQPLENQDDQIEKNIYSDTVHDVFPISEIQAKAMIQVLEYHMELNLEDNFDSKKGKSSKQVIHDINVINMGVCHSLYINKGPLEATFPNLNVYVQRKGFHDTVHSMVAEVSIPSLLNKSKHVSIQLYSFFSSAENEYADDICLSLVQYPTEYFQSFSLSPHKMLISEVLEVKFLCPQDDCTLQINSLHLTITLPVIDGYSGDMCLKWTTSGWMENYCETKEMIEAQHFFKCMCFTPGFYSVSGFASNISESITDQTLQMSFVNDSESVALIIGLVDVKDINLKEQKARFLIHLRDQLAENLGIQASQIERIVLEEDELLLKFIVLPGFNSSTASLTSIVRTLYHMVNNEVLNLTDLAGKRVKVVPYTLSLNNSLHLATNDILGNTVDADLEQKDSRLSIIQILMIISAVISVMLVTSFVVLKYRRKKLIKVVPITSPIDVSSYSGMF
ncbi:uncharacterized protein LOC143227211 [Tachypleus tridentatus]|uniref:uncharacterized protein LOC143227211 n=1 Tax=Tachypleus tridentatus TaxID=6853 RepID=UPI003FD243B4